MILPEPREFTPALRGLIETFIQTGSYCLDVGNGHGGAIGSSLVEYGCGYVGADASQASSLPFENESFDAALLIGVLDRLIEPNLAAAELRRVLRPGGVLLVTAPNVSYWRRRLDGSLYGHDPREGSLSAGALRRMLQQAGFGLVGVEGLDGSIVRDIPLARCIWKGRASAPYRIAERLFPSMLGSRVGASAIRI
jgi:SAM-dependent methyltransferase